MNPSGQKVADHLSPLVKAEARLEMIARLKQGWDGILPRVEARALLNELRRLRLEAR